jgi:hypothetical protein
MREKERDRLDILVGQEGRRRGGQERPVLKVKIQMIEVVGCGWYVRDTLVRLYP